MGTIKATNIEPIADNGTVTLGSSGDTFTLGSGVVQSNLNYPAFEAYNSGNQSLSDASATKLEFDTEVFDSNGTFSSNRFTPGVAGKYFIYSQIPLDSEGTGSDYIILQLYKNGSRVFANRFYEGSLDLDEPSISINIVLDLAVSDYIEIYGAMGVGSGNPT